VGGTREGLVMSYKFIGSEGELCIDKTQGIMHPKST